MTDVVQKIPPAAQTVLHYAIPGNDKGGRLLVYGPRNAGHILIFCPGFPDDQECFIPLATRMAQTGDCLCGIACLLGYDAVTTGKREERRQQGYTFEENIVALRTAIQTLQAYSQKVGVVQTVGIFHDWGSVIGALATHRIQQDETTLSSGKNISKLCYFDVLPVVPPNLKKQIPDERDFWTTTLYFIPYTFLFAFGFLCDRFYVFAPFPDHIVLGVMKYSFLFFMLTKVSPILGLDFDTWVTFHQSRLSVRHQLYMGYMYFNMYMGWIYHPFAASSWFQEKPQVGVALGLRDGFYLPENLQETPVLFLYGTKKRLMYHSTNHAEWLAKHDSCKVLPVNNAGHWLHLQQPDICFEELRDFVLSG